jgi:hypothetical protein
VRAGSDAAPRRFPVLDVAIGIRTKLRDADRLHALPVVRNEVEQRHAEAAAQFEHPYDVLAREARVDLGAHVTDAPLEVGEAAAAMLALALVARRRICGAGGTHRRHCPLC